MDNMKKLKLMASYNRKEVHDIFAPNTPFTQGAGTWGIHGIVKIPNREKDYVFFVTFGQKTASHDFVEHITNEGILTWQSQIRQSFKSKDIENIINHNYLKENIYLFLRAEKTNKRGESQPFLYLGKLAYIEHDRERQEPVHFKWQLLQWNQVIKEQIEKQGISIIDGNYGRNGEKNKLIEKDLPLFGNKKRSKTTRQFKANKIDFAANTLINKEIGDLGEQLVLKFEQNRLKEAGRNDLAENLIHTSLIEGDGAGYDILSYNNEGDPIYIEVKTTTGGANSPFNISPNELEFSSKNSKNYILRRIYSFDINQSSGEFYDLKGDLTKKLSLEPTGYLASLDS
ncbi:DUF3427 domain-containing protein [Salinicoccus roseus]|uniref:DUF3427 domain-containing protein n=1 Tax=Salinicoccus roseus TaxID=45670 RepID=UPI002301D30F|nr:DUF3427 domain-containing protein [Salinicoccus roseus]